MGDIRESPAAQTTKPKIDATLAKIMLGFHFLSDQRLIAIGMSGGIPLSIPISEMLSYFEVFKPEVDKQHFVRVIRAADNEYIRLQSEKQKRKQKQKTKAPTQGSANAFPELL